MKAELLREIERLKEVKDTTLTKGWSHFMETLRAIRESLVKELCNPQHNNDTLRVAQGRIEQIDNIIFYGENVDNFIEGAERDLTELEHPEEDD